MSIFSESNNNINSIDITRETTENTETTDTADAEFANVLAECSEHHQLWNDYAGGYSGDGGPEDSDEGLAEDSYDFIDYESDSDDSVNSIQVRREFFF